MSIILWIIFAALMGWTASILMKTSKSVLVAIVIGTTCGSVAGLIMSYFGSSGMTSFSSYSLLLALIGAIALIVTAKALRRSLELIKNVKFNY
ncbi:MAG: GlsB/YeaQ/YmgE family stress response membrane protein [bacterium]|nr:GlsB/YeaQ/YmgE family stress response membrane protein [bacterium]